MCRIVILVIVCLIGFASAESVLFQDCAHNEVLKLTSSLSNGTAITLHKGKNFTFEAVFKAGMIYSSSNITVRVTVVQNGQEKNVTHLYFDGCKEGLKCPLKAGEEYTLNYLRFIPETHPTIIADFVMRLWDEMDRILACFKITVEIQN